MDGNAFDVARKRRRELHEAMIELEDTLAQARAGAGWAGLMRAAAGRVREALAHHIGDTEGPAGIIEAMRERAPRLDAGLTGLETEHVRLASAADALASLADRQGPAHDLRVRALDLLGALARHRQRGADLVYDAYDVDIGGQA